MSTSDNRAVRMTATGSAGVGPARIRTIVLTSTAGAGRLTVLNGENGSTALDLDIIASSTHSVTIDGNGIRVSDIWISAFANLTAVTFFYS